MSGKRNPSDAQRDWLDEIDPSMIPHTRMFPIESYSDILSRGMAAASQKRYSTRADATKDAKGVAQLLGYYRKWHPEIAPQEFGYRVWPSREDGRFRWAILPEKSHGSRKRSSR